MAFIDWIQNNYVLLLQILGGLIGVGTAFTGLFNGERAQGVAAVLVKIGHFFSAVAPINSPGSLSIPLTTVDIKPKATE